jgi:hypothetical protein
MSGWVRGWRRILSLSFALWIMSPSSWSGQNQTLIRMARTAAMGGAGVGLADDENALFQNAAGLVGLEERRFKLVSVGVEASMDAVVSFSDSVSAFSDFSIATLNQFMGQDIYVRAGQTAVVLLPHFALAYVVDLQTSLFEYALSNPNFELGYQTTHGVQAGTGWKFSSGRRPTSEWRVGVAGKVLWRRGGFYQLQTAGFLQAATQGKAYLDQLTGGFGMGFGLDAGVQFVNRIDPKTQFLAGVSITDVGDTRFSEPKASRLEQTLNLGLGWKQKMDFGDLSLGLDFRNLTKNISFASKTHFGAELKIPAIQIMAGFNQLNYTWGMGFDLWVLKLQALSTAEEFGVAKGQNTSRRYMLLVDFNLPI